jgi:hypothetical protein
MNSREYCEVDLDGSNSNAWFYDEAGQYIDRPKKPSRLGIFLATLGHDSWELVSTCVGKIERLLMCVNVHPQENGHN